MIGNAPFLEGQAERLGVDLPGEGSEDISKPLPDLKGVYKKMENKFYMGR